MLAVRAEEINDSHVKGSNQDKKGAAQALGPDGGTLRLTPRGRLLGGGVTARLLA